MRSYFEILPIQPHGFQNFGGESVDYLNITEDKPSKTRPQTKRDGRVSTQT